MTKRILQQKNKIKKLEQQVKDLKYNAETWKYYYKNSQNEVHRLHQIIKKLEKKDGLKRLCPACRGKGKVRKRE